MSYNLLIFLVAFSAMLVLACASYKKMLNMEKKLIAEGKEVPKWIETRRRGITNCYSNFKNHKVVMYLACLCLILIIEFSGCLF